MASLSIDLRLGSNYYYYIICHWTGVMERPPPPTQGEWIPFLRQVSANGGKDYIKPVNLKGAKLYQQENAPKNIN